MVGEESVGWVLDRVRPPSLLVIGLITFHLNLGTSPDTTRPSVCWANLRSASGRSCVQRADNDWFEMEFG